MIFDVHLKENDTWPPLMVKLLDADNNPIPIEDAYKIKFIMTKYKDRTNVIIDTEISGIEKIDEEYWATYLWQENDTSEAGRYQAEFVIYLDQEKVITVPNGNDYIYIQIGNELGQREV